MKHRASIKVHPRAYNKWFCDDYNYCYSQIKSGSKWVVLEKSTIDLVGKLTLKIGFLSKADLVN